MSHSSSKPPPDAQQQGRSPHPPAAEPPQRPPRIEFAEPVYLPDIVPWKLVKVLSKEALANLHKGLPKPEKPVQYDANIYEPIGER